MSYYYLYRFVFVFQRSCELKAQLGFSLQTYCINDETSC